MRPKYSEEKVIDAIGRLDENEDGEFVITIELKDETITKSLNELAKIAEGSMVQFKSVDSE